MTNPVSGNSALIPRRPEKPREEWSEKRVEEDSVFVGYAPPGAQWQAKVRRLGEEGAAPVSPVKEESHQVVPKGGVTVERNGDAGITLKIQAEVTVLGALPPNGVAIETVTVVRGSGKNGDKA